MSYDSDRIAAERAVLLRDVAEAFVALRNSPEWVVYEAAEHRLIEHRVLYGDGDLTREPKGILHDPTICGCDAEDDD